MNIRKFTALVLAAVMCTAALPSCANQGEDTPVTRPPEKGSEESGNFVDADFEGQKFVILAAEVSDYESNAGNAYYCEELDPEAMSGNIRSNAAFTRNLAVEDKYNVEVESLRCEDPGDELKSYYMSGDICFDAIYGWANRLGAQISQNYFYDFYDVENINLEAEYWNPSSIDDLTIAGRLFLCTNDISYERIAWGSLLFFNKQILQEYNLTSPHDHVDAGTWTTDELLNMIKAVHEEVDGDNKFTKNDRYGGLLISEGDLLSGAGMFYTDKNEDGTYSLAMGSEKTINFMEKIKEVLKDTNYVMTWDAIMKDGDDMSGYNNQWWYSRSFFSGGHSLFMSGSAGLTEELRDMKDPYGVVPCPKYNSDQKEYYANVDPCASLFAIPFDPRNIEMTGIILEYMAYKSNEIYIPAYYETTIKTQRMQDEKDQEMLDIVKDSTRFEWTDVLAATSSDGNPFADARNTMYNSRGMASAFKRNETKLTNVMNDWYDEIAALSQNQPG